MTKLIKLGLAGMFIGAIFFLSGCNSSTTYYGGYYDPYPRWGYSHTHHYHYRPGRPHRPNRPDRPVRPKPPRPIRPTRPTPRAR